MSSRDSVGGGPYIVEEAWLHNGALRPELVGERRGGSKDHPVNQLEISDFAIIGIGDFNRFSSATSVKSPIRAVIRAGWRCVIIRIL